MTDIAELLKRQAEWQKSLKDLTWEEKVRMAERVRDCVAQLKRAKARRPDGSMEPQPESSSKDASPVAKPARGRTQKSS